MNGKQAMCFTITTLLVFASFSILPIDGKVICPWCDTSMQSRLLDCVYAELIGRIDLLTISLPDIENIKLQVTLYSASLGDAPYDVKKLKVDEKFVLEIVKVIKKYNYQNNPAMVNEISDLAGKCYSLVTGYDPNVVIHDIIAIAKDDMRDTTPLENPNLRKPNSANRNQQRNFPTSRPPIQPTSNNSPVQSPIWSPASDDYPSQNNFPGSRPANSLNNRPIMNNGQSNPPGLLPANRFNNRPIIDNGQSNPSGLLPANSFGNPPKNALLNPRVLPTQSANNPSSVNNIPGPSENLPSNYNNFGEQPDLTSLGNPPFRNRAPPRRPSPRKLYRNPLVNNAPGPSENFPSNDYKGQAKSDFSNNQPPSDGPPDSRKVLTDKKSPYNAGLASTVSPKISSPSQDSKLTDSNSSENSNWTTPSPNIDASQKKTAEKGKSNDEPCDEKFKIILYNKLINDDRFLTFFKKRPISATLPEVPKIMNHAFKEYGIQQHYKEFYTSWRLESQMLNEEPTIDNFVSLITKILKIIFSGNYLLKGDCEAAAKKMAGYILDTLPGNPVVENTNQNDPTKNANQNDPTKNTNQNDPTKNTNQNDGNEETSTKPNSNSSRPKSNLASNSTADTSAENNSNSDKYTDSGNQSFPELHSKLASIFKHDGSTEQEGGKVPLSELLSNFEIQENLRKLHRAAENCVSPSGFDFKKFLIVMTNVRDSIQKNHPNWSQDKCQKEMLSAALAAMTKLLQDTLKNSNKNGKGQSLPTQPVSSVDASDSQSLNFGTQSKAPNEYNLSSDDPTYPGKGTNFDSNIVPPPQQDFGNYRGNVDEPRPVNIPQSDNQPVPGDWNPGLIQPSNLAPGPVNTNYGDLSSSSQPDSAPKANDYNLSSGDPTYLGQRTGFDSNSVPRPQNDFTNYVNNAGGTGPINIPQSGNQPGQGDWNDGLAQPTNFAPNNFNTNYGDSSKGNLQNGPVWNPSAQNFPGQDYPSFPPSSMETQPYSGFQPFPASQNSGLQQSPNLPGSGGMNFPNESPSRSDNYGNDNSFNAGPPEAQPVAPNGNFQNFPPRPDFGVPATGPNYNSQPDFNSNYNSGDTANGPVIPQW